MFKLFKSGFALVALFSISIALVGCQDFVNDLKDIDVEELMRVELLYVQSASNGTFSSLDPSGQTPRYRLEFRDISPVTHYFSDKPNKVAGTLTTSEFLNLGVFSGGPIHAAVVLRNHNNRNEDVVMGILSNPNYNPVSAILSYEIFLLSSPPEPALNHWPGMLDMQLPRSFGEVSIFVSSELCPPNNLAC